MSRPIIGIDASRALEQERTGTENYSFHLTQEMLRADSEFDFLLFTKKGQALPLGWGRPGVETGEIRWGRLWTQGGLALESWKRTLSALFIPAHVIPYLKNPFLPTVVTVHDLRTEFLPQHKSLIQQFYLNIWTERLRAKLANHLIAVSNATKADIEERLHVSASKVSVVYEGFDRESFSPTLLKSKIIHDVLNQYEIVGPYLFYVGTIQPRKNLERLIEAFSLLRKEHPELTLVLAGKPGWLAAEIYEAPRRFDVVDGVKFLDFVSEYELPYLMAGAKLLAFPSLYEGFGIPVLEAFASGVPVVTSNISSLPEVGGELAVYVDPYDVQSIVDGLQKGLNISLDSALVKAHLEQFSWEKAAKETLEVIRKVL